MERKSQFRVIVAAAVTGAVSALVLGGGILTAVAQQNGKIDILDLVTDRTPKVRVNADEVDHRHLVAQRIDIVDEKGVIRMTLAGELPNPIVDGIQYKRSAPVSGIMLRDDKGNERGGFGFHKSGHALIALDHVNGEAVGMLAASDGSTSIFMGGRGEVVRDPRLGGKIVPMPGSAGPSQLRVSIDENGGQALTLTDMKGRPRLRLHVTDEGHGEIQFLDAEGKVVGRHGPDTQ
ncbi:MAG: hypothetical protein ACLFV8_12585 [Alphaproteobacteria bacterium]